MTSSAIGIRPVASAADKTTFMRLANAIYADDPNYVAPLEFELGARLDAAKNPTLKSSPHQLWVAYKDGAPVGRIASIINKAHLEIHRDSTGHFGFLECVDDPEIMGALIDAASTWIRGQGMEHIAGPYNFSVNEECGLLVDGFDSRP